jgi:hypothetical protein
MCNKKTNVNITFGHFWTLLDTFAHTFGPFLDICVYLIKWVIKKQM